jgi:LPXTG-motif cell wall-anchored protein
MILEERLKYCEKCKNKSSDYMKNTICGLTSSTPVFNNECNYFSPEGSGPIKNENKSKNNFFGTWKSALLLAALAGYNIVRGFSSKNYFNVAIGIVLITGWLFFVFTKKK